MNPPDASRQFARLTYEALIARAAGLLGGLAANILIARSLGAEGKGLLAILAVWSGLLASLFSGGAYLATVYELGVRPFHARHLLSATGPYVLVATLLAATGVMFFRQRIDLSEIFLVLVVLLFASQLLSNLSTALLAGLRHLSIINWLSIFSALCSPIVIISIWWTRGSLSVPMVTLCMVIMPVLAALIGFSFSRRKAAQISVTGESRFQWPPFLQYMLKSTATSMGSMLFAQIVLLVFSARGTPAQVGVFSVATIFIETASVIPVMLASFVLPRWAGLPGPEVAVRAGRVLRLTHPVSLLIAITAAFTASALAGPVFGRDFTGVGLLAWIMIPGAWATTGVTVLSNYFLSQNRHMPSSITVWLGTVLGGLLAWWLIPLWGGVGAALALSLSRLTSLLWAWITFARANPGSPQMLWIPDREVFHTWGQMVSHLLDWMPRRSIT
jgi:O-antigen/teichoic acid export membrane protein